MSNSTKSISSQGKASLGSSIVIVIFFGIFATVGIIGTYRFLLLPLYRTVAAQNWNEVTCTVISSELKSFRSDDSTTYKIDIHYRYQFGGQTYTSNRYDVFNISSSGRDNKAKIVAQHKPGSTVPCYVDPNSPSDAVLMRGWSMLLLFGLIPLPFLLIGVGGLIGFFFLSGKETDKINNKKPIQKEMLPPAKGPKGKPLVLKPQSTPLGRFIGTVFVAIFWNGIVSIFVYQAYKSWISGDPSWFLTLFLIPFVLIGLGILFGVVYYFLALFNPKTIVTISSDQIALGDTVNISWRIEGRSNILSGVRVYFEGREEARYRRGTSTYTDQEVFRTIEIYKSEGPLRAKQGQANVQIPNNTMHSFKSDNNSIVWVLHIHGAIKFWPDMMHDFVLQILPGPATNG